MKQVILHEQDKGCYLRVYVQPRSRRTACVGVFDESLKITLDTPPIDGKANQRLLQFFSETLSVSLSKISIKRGEKSRRKLLWIEGAKEKELSAVLTEACPALAQLLVEKTS